jgi:hypothetical protein
MKEPYEKGVATHLAPESWVLAREGARQALTGARVGWVLSREICTVECPGSSTSRRQHEDGRQREHVAGSTRSETPSMLGNTTTEPGRSRDPSIAGERSWRKGKSKDGSPR